jgi:molybdenum cofactor sulfurtransferase
MWRLALTLSLKQLRAQEFSRLDTAGHVYLDYTGSGLYGESQIRTHAALLCEGALGNPHSQNPASLRSTRLVAEARERIRRFFNAGDDYEVVFTLNASGGLKLVGESYAFEPGSRLLLTTDNHNSVNGIREFATSKRARVKYVPLDGELRVPELESYLVGADPTRPNMLAFPAQSNFSGVKHPHEWVELAHRLGYDVLLDAAAYVPTSPLDLTALGPEFVAVSFYKMFGFPTGVGALIAKRSALAKLRRPWFAGGTVRFASAQNPLHLLHPTGEAFEDGTLNYLSIAAIPAGLDLIESVGIDQINRHVMRLTEQLLASLPELRHSNGAPMIRIYGPTDPQGRGATVSFNVLDPQGRLFDSKLVEIRAGERQISLRTGCFCNPGAAETAFRYGQSEAYECFDRLSPAAFTLQQFSTCMDDKPVGAVRASLGIASNAADVQRLIDLLSTLRDTTAPPALVRSVPEVVSG